MFAAFGTQETLVKSEPDVNIDTGRWSAKADSLSSPTRLEGMTFSGWQQRSSGLRYWTAAKQSISRERTRTVQADTTGKGIYEFLETTNTTIDGSTIANDRHPNADGATKDRMVTTVSCW